jgi:hypothetical protein
VRSLERRQVLKTASLAGLGLLLPPELLRAAPSPRDAEDVAGRGRWLVVTAHQAAVVEEATARLIPGPLDDPSERGHPGAREADVTRYIDTMLGALSLSPAKVFAGGPFSNRAGNPSDDMAEFIGLTPGQAYGWKRRIAGWRHQYSVGIASPARAAGGSSLRAPAPAPVGHERVAKTRPGCRATGEEARQRRMVDAKATGQGAYAETVPLHGRPHRGQQVPLARHRRVVHAPPPARLGPFVRDRASLRRVRTAGDSLRPTAEATGT